MEMGEEEEADASRERADFIASAPSCGAVRGVYVERNLAMGVRA